MEAGEFGSRPHRSNSGARASGGVDESLHLRYKVRASPSGRLALNEEVGMGQGMSSKNFRDSLRSWLS